MRLTMTWTVFLALVVSFEARAQDETAPPPDPAPQVAEVITERDPAEIAAFKAAQERFGARMKELEADTREFLDEREKLERDKLSAGYDVAIDALDEEVRGQRVLAIERFEQFLQRYPDTPYASHIRFRLADLYWEQAKEQWLALSADYFALEEQMIAEHREDELPPEPIMDLAGPVALYERIIADNRGLPKEQRYEYLDGALYSLAFVFKESNAAQYDEDRARQTFLDLLAIAPDSALADDAHLNLGNFEFESNNFDEAIAEYRLVYMKGPESRLYPDAMYQLAWSYYKLDRYLVPNAGDPVDATALALFVKLLDFSEESVKNTGRKSDYAPDAIKFMAFSFADLAVDTGNSVQVARSFFAQVGPREYEWDVYVALAQALSDYGRFDEAIAVYTALQQDERWKVRPENPKFQMQVVRLYASGPSQDLAKSAAARIELTERYNDTSEWWTANKYNPEALSAARGFIEDSLADVAIEYLKDAEDNGGDQAQYALAASKFREYLDKFPISDDYYQMQWYLAYTLYQGKDYAGAAKEYTSLARSHKHHKFGDGSVYQLMRSRQEMMVAARGQPGDLPADAVVERTYTSPGNKEVTVYNTSQEHKDFIAAADQVLVFPFKTPEDPNETDWAKLVSENRAALMYLPAQILFVHHRYEEARPRLLAVVDQLKCTDEAAYAAGLLVDSFTLEGDLPNVRKYTTLFIRNPPGCGSASAIDTEKFQNILEQTAFVEASNLVDAGKRDEAAVAFLQFITDFPDSKYRPDALYNAANNYDIVGKAEKANELYERYVNEYPKDARSAGLYYRIAANYESVFDLTKAVDYYKRLLTNFPDDPTAADAQYNMSFLKIGVGDHTGAAKGFELYASQYPEREDARDVLFQAGEEWERVGATQAIAFYTDYRKTYGLQNPTNAMICDYKIATLYKAQGNTKKYDEGMDKVLEDFNTIVAADGGATLKPEARHYAAESGFRSIQASYDRLTTGKLSGNEEKDAKMIADKETELATFRETSITQVTAFQDFEYSTAVLYLRASALFWYAELGLSLRPPAGLSEDDTWAYQDILDQQVYPKFFTLEDKAKAELKETVALGKDKKLHSIWISKSLELLNKYEPLEFPAEKVELKGDTDSAIKTEILPRKMEVKKPETTP